MVDGAYKVFCSQPLVKTKCGKYSKADDFAGNVSFFSEDYKSL